VLQRRAHQNQLDAQVELLVPEGMACRFENARGVKEVAIRIVYFMRRHWQ
jgi:hypothetical protein